MKIVGAGLLREEILEYGPQPVTPIINPNGAPFGPPVEEAIEFVPERFRMAVASANSSGAIVLAPVSASSFFRAQIEHLQPALLDLLLQRTHCAIRAPGLRLGKELRCCPSRKTNTATMLCSADYSRGVS
jgi:hypothetical protein